MNGDEGRKLQKAMPMSTEQSTHNSRSVSATLGLPRGRAYQLPATNDPLLLSNTKPPQPAHVIQGGERLVRMPELISLIGLSRATVYRYIKSGNFPAPMQLSKRCVAWKASSINDWLLALKQP